MEFNKLLVYGWSGLLNNSSTGAISTIWPAYITQTLSAVWATTPKSWVINIIPEFIWFCNSFIKSRICAWIVTSSAVVGSSAIKTWGLQLKAIAIITLCLIPPDNWWGNCLAITSAFSIPTFFRRSTAFAWRCFLSKSVWYNKASSICSPILINGLRDANGSWNIIPISPPLNSLNWASVKSKIFSPLYITSPLIWV